MCLSFYEAQFPYSALVKCYHASSIPDQMSHECKTQTETGLKILFDFIFEELMMVVDLCFSPECQAKPQKLSLSQSRRCSSPRRRRVSTAVDSACLMLNAGCGRGPGAVGLIIEQFLLFKNKAVASLISLLMVFLHLL